MISKLRKALVVGASLAAFGIAVGPVSASKNNVERIEVAFVLDTTGSMAGLIDGAKQKIWAIANSIVDINPDAKIHMALVGYRDRGDDYVVRMYQMSSDIQGLYGDLMRFQADGGGDTPESVNEALDTAVEDVAWSSGDRVRRIIFLVGDAPPQMNYAAPKYPEIIRRARQDDIIVHTIQAGDDPITREFWKEIAKLGGGDYFAIPQNGGQVQVYNSPYDQKIIDLQRRIDRTAVPYGNRAQQDEYKAKVEARAAAPAAVQVDNSRYYSKKSEKEIVTGGGDLLDDVRNNVRPLEAIAAEELPDDLKGLSKEDLGKTVAERTAARKVLEREMANLVEQRDAHVAEAMKNAPADSFDQAVSFGVSSRF